MADICQPFLLIIDDLNNIFIAFYQQGVFNIMHIYKNCENFGNTLDLFKKHGKI